MNRNYDPQPKFFNLGIEPIIGRHCSLVNTLLDCSAQITIGDDVSFGHDVKLLTGKHDYSKFGKERMDISICKPIIIKNGAWIASGAIILGGVMIGEDAVVAAGAVVTKDVEPGIMVGGVPARIIKHLI